MGKIQIYTDGSCDGNPGKGGYCALIKTGSRIRTITGSKPCSTNNKMELIAAIEGLRTVKPGSAVRLFSDSYYLTGPWTEGRISQWIANGWRRIRTGEEIQNREIWEELLSIIQRKHLDVEFVKLPAHKGHKFNEIADFLARQAAKSM